MEELFKRGSQSGKSGLENERGGDDEQDAGELQSQAALVGVDTLQSVCHVARVTKFSSDEDVECNDDDDRHDGDKRAVDCVHDEVREFEIRTMTADLQYTTPTTSRLKSNYILFLLRNCIHQTMADTKYNYIHKQAT